jgi:cytochrome c biogenesis protein CcmG, thiol:disulfide interchange protein DsbE
MVSLPSPRAARPALLVAVLSLLFFACSSGSPSSEGGSGSERLPAISLPHLGDAEPLRLADIDGPVVINLWATWCAPCRRELPDFEQVHQEMGDEVRFIGVNLGDRASDAARFISEVGVTFAQYLDEDGTLNERLGTATLPVTVITDDLGRISTIHSGPMDAKDLRLAIAAARG